MILLAYFQISGKQKNDSVIEEIRSNNIRSFTDILKTFGNIIVDLDAEFGIDDAQYKSITQKLADISKGNFNVEDIIDTYTYEDKNFEYGFTLNDKKYKIKLYQKDDWLDMNFWELIQASRFRAG